MAGYKTNGSHRHTRLNRYTGDVSSRRKRRRGFRLWWIIPICALAAFVLALLLGSFLGSLVTGDGKDTSDSDPTETDPPLSPPETVHVGNVNGVFVGLEGITDNTYSNVSKQIPEGTGAISLSMFYSNGDPFYRSEVADAFGQTSGELTLGNIFKYAKENGIYVSVPFPSEALSMDDSIKGGVRAAYEFELIKELYGAGADEVIIRCVPFGSQSADLLRNDEYMERVTEYLHGLRIKVPDIHIGFMISADDAADGSLAGIIHTVDTYADFIAVDMTGSADTESLTASIEASLANLLRYEMRALLGNSGDEEQLGALLALLDSFGISNRQVATPAK